MIKLMTDSTAYLPQEMIQQHDIQVIPLSVHLNEELHEETSISQPAFFQQLGHTEKLPTSSQPPVNLFVEHFSKAVELGQSVIGVFISSDMSGTYQTALMARDMVLEKAPQAVIHLIDSRTNCMQMGFAVLEAAKGITKGLSLPQVLENTSSLIRKSRFVFAPLTLEYLKKGGRIGGASAFLGSMLKIIPILTVEDGKTAVLTKVRTHKKALATMIQTLQSDFSEFGAGQVVVHHINDEPAGKALADTIEGILSTKVPVISIGPVIGLHVGPGTVGIAYTTEKERV